MGEVPAEYPSGEKAPEGPLGWDLTELEALHARFEDSVHEPDRQLLTTWTERADGRIPLQRTARMV
jgi:hypothetical protein